MMYPDPLPHPHHQDGFSPKQLNSAPVSPGPPTSRGSKKHIWYGLGGIAIGLFAGAGLVGGVIGINAQAAANAQAAKAGLISEAFEGCALDSVEGATLSADMMSVDIDGAGTYFGPDLTDVHCLGDALGMPDSVSSRMGQTRALDGTQTADWDTFTVSWNYHPDDGLGAIFEYVPES